MDPEYLLDIIEDYIPTLKELIGKDKARETENKEKEQAKSSDKRDSEEKEEKEEEGNTLDTSEDGAEPMEGYAMDNEEREIMGDMDQETEEEVHIPEELKEIITGGGTVTWSEGKERVVLQGYDGGMVILEKPLKSKIKTRADFILNEITNDDVWEDEIITIE